MLSSLKTIWREGGPQLCYGWTVGMGQYIVGVGGYSGDVMRFRDANVADLTFLTEQKMAAGVWSTIFSEALSGLTIKLIPPTLDQVLVGSIERSRHPDIRAIFLIGATQKQFPVPVTGRP